MLSPPTAADIDAFFHASLRALIRAEVQGRVPARFTGTGADVWRAFRNELTTTDLAALAIADAGITMPVPFAPATWWAGWPDWPLHDRELAEIDAWIDQARRDVGLVQEVFLQDQAAILGLTLPPASALASLPTPAAHQHWLELPGTGGGIAFQLCIRPESDLYFWENFSILCASPQEMLLAGFIAWELDTPPGKALPIHLGDADLGETLRAGQTYHAVVGRKDLHGHRDLRVLQREHHPPIWIS